MKSSLLLLTLCLGVVLGENVDLYSDQGACDPETRPRLIESDLVMIWTPDYREVPTYPPNTLCEWLIRAPAGQDSGVEVRFGGFDVQTCNNCGCDYVEAFDGADDTGDSLGRKCGTATTSYTSFGNELFLRFSSNDDGIEREGFNAQLIQQTVAPRECIAGNDPLLLTAATGTVRSPGYPTQYIPNLRCQWQLSVPDAVGYKLIFDDPFATEFCCECDFLQMHRGTSSADVRIGTWWGQDAPYHVGSRGADLYVMFNTDSSTELEGFQFTYEAVYSESELAEWMRFVEKMYGPRFID
jgi:hypothetical protein